jgi:transposase
MRKIYHVDLSEAEREELESIVKRRKSSSESVKRSHILLACDRLGDKKWKDSQISDFYKVSIRTIERLRERYVNEGIKVSISGKPRPNLDKIKFDGEVEAKLIALRCSEPQTGQSSWTLQLLADKMVELSYVESISYESVRQLLKKTR